MTSKVDCFSQNLKFYSARSFFSSQPESCHLKHFVFFSQLFSAETCCCHWLDLIPEICKSTTEGYAREKERERISSYRRPQVPVTGGRHTLVASRKVEGCVPTLLRIAAATLLRTHRRDANWHLTGRWLKYLLSLRKRPWFAFMRVMIRFCMRAYLRSSACDVAPTHLPYILFFLFQLWSYALLSDIGWKKNSNKIHWN